MVSRESDYIMTTLITLYIHRQQKLSFSTMLMQVRTHSMDTRP